MKLLYVVTEDWYFYSHRLPMARAAIEAGFDVAVVTNVNKHRDAIEKTGIRVIPWALKRESLNPLGALGQIAALVKIYKTEKPDIVHHTAMKPILFGSIAAYLSKSPRVINAFAGLGIIFHGKGGLTAILRTVISILFRIFLKRPGCWTLFQNADDLAKMNALNLIVPARSKIIRGSGIDMAHYKLLRLAPAPPFVCIYAGRMIESKGLPTMQDAFEILRDKAPHIHLWLCGAPDHGNPGSWDEKKLREWCAKNPAVQWLGHQTDMARIWPKAHLALQPSWGGEGLPKALLEAGACGRAMVASDVSGCREIVLPGINGRLVPAENAQALADAIFAMAGDPELCGKMGIESRKIVEQNFSADIITEETRKFYKTVLDAN